MAIEIKPEFHLPSAIFVRPELLQNIADIVRRYGSRTVLVTTSSDFEFFQETIETISMRLKEQDIGCIIYDEIPPSPNTEDIDIAVSFINKTNCDLIIGFGGVESLNAAKAISLLLDNYIFCHDLVTRSKQPEKLKKYITIPAFPVFGFEIAPMLFLDEIHNLTKRIIYHPDLYPVATIVDPVVSLSIREEQMMKYTLSTLAISTESIISRGNNEIINTYALKSIDMIFRNLPLAYQEPKNATPRSYLSTSSVMSGIAFSTAFLSITLAISLALTSRTEMDIESAMSVILPHIMEFNLTSSPGKYVQMSKVMGEEVRDITVIEAAIKSIEAIRKLESDVDVIQRLSSYNVQKTVFKDIAKLAVTYPFIENTPREINESEIETILIAAY